MTPNDAGDADTGANQLQNFPVIESGTRTAGNTEVAGTLSSTASTTFAVDFYSVNSCNATGNGEGRTYLSSEDVVTNGSGVGTFTETLTGEHPFVTSTATAPDGSTSEFSGCFATNTQGGQTADLQVSKAGSGTGTVTSSPSGIDCGTDCSQAYPLNTVVTLTATPPSNSAFTGWSGACTNAIRDLCRDNECSEERHGHIHSSTRPDANQGRSRHGKCFFES